MKLKVITATGASSSLTVKDEVFGQPVNQVLLAQAVRVYMANQRQGGAKVKRRGEVSLTTAKWFRQKGTGRARHGAQSAPQFVGGGVAHGPRGNQNWTLKLTPVMKRKALIAALSAQAEQTFVSDQLEQLNGKTAQAAKFITSAAGTAKRVLVIIDQAPEKMLRSLRNLPQVVVTRTSRTTALEVAQANVILTTEAGVKALEARLLASTTAKPAVLKTTVKTETKPKATKTAAPKAPKAKAAAPKATSTKKVTKKAVKAA